MIGSRVRSVGARGETRAQPQKMCRWIVRASGIAAVLVSIGCSGSDGRERSFESPPEEWRLVDTVRIGSVSGPDDALTRVGAVLPMPDGGVWFTQPSEQQIRIVDETGRLVARVGGRGQGPGEFTAVGALGFWHGSSDTVWVQDWVLRRIALFERDGAFVRTVAVPDVNWGDRWSVEQIRAIGPDGVGLALGRYAPGVAWDDGFPLLRFTLSSGEVLGEVARVERTATIQIQWENEVVASGAHPLPDAPIVSHSSDGRLVSITERETDRSGADPQVRTVVLEADGDTAWHRSFGYDPEPIPPREVDSIWGERIHAFQRFAELEGRMDPEEAERAFRSSVPIPPHRPPIEAVQVDTGGRVLLLWSAGPGRARQAWVLAPGGDLVASFTLPPGQELLAFEGDHVWALELDVMEVPFVLRYRVGPGP